MSGAAHAGAAPLLASAAMDLSTGHVLVQMVVALGIVLGAVWLLARLARRTRRFAERAPAAAARGSAGSKWRERGGALWRAAHAQLAGKQVSPTRVTRVPAARRRITTKGPEVTIASRRPIARGKSIALVDVGCRRFLVGISETGFTQLGEVPREEPVAETGRAPDLVGVGRVGEEGASASAAAQARGTDVSAPTASVSAWLDALRGGSVAR